MRKAVKGLLFDKDGTLFNFHATWSVWCAGFIADISGGEQGLASDLADVLDFSLARGKFNESAPFIAGTIDDTIDPLLRLLPAWSRVDLMRHMLESASLAPQAPVVDLAPLLMQFKRNTLKIGVATNDNEVPARAHLGAASVLHHFDFISGCDSGFGAKPAPGMLLGFCEATGLEPSEVAMVGDSTHDLAAGRAAGMINIAVLTGPARAEILAPLADVVLADIGGIPDWLGLK